VNEINLKNLSKTFAKINERRKKLKSLKKTFTKIEKHVIIIMSKIKEQKEL